MIIIILLLGLALRLININQSLWLDEAVQAITAKASFSNIFQEILGDFHPPLYHFLMHYWVRIFGDSEIALRMPSVLFGVGTIYLVYKLGKLGMFGRVGVLAAVLLATSPFHICYSQEARMYSMATFLSVLSMFYFVKFISHKEPDGTISNLKDQISKTQLKAKNLNINILLYLISTLCLIYTDYYGFLVFLAQAIYLLIKKKYKFLLLNSIFLILCFLPWLPIFIKQIQTGMLATQSLPGWGKLVNVSFLKAIPLTLIKFTIGRITIFDKRIYGIFSLGIFGMLGLLGGLGIIRKIRNEQGRIIILWFFVPLLISWLSSLFIPNFQPFRLLLILPAFYLILAEGIAGIEGGRGERWGRRVMITIFLAINLASLSVYYFNPYFQREDWKRLVGFLKQNTNSLVILPSQTSNWPIRYYDKENKINLIGVGKDIGEIREISEIGERRKNEKLFYIRYLVPVFDPNEKILSELSKEGYNKIKEVSFNQISVWEYK